MRILLLLPFFLGTALQAQEKPSVWVPPLQATEPKAVRSSFLAQCHARFQQALLETGALALVDRSLLELVEAERELQKTEAFLDGKFVAQGMALGAAYILKGTYHQGPGRLSVDIVETGTGQLVAREEIALDPRWNTLQLTKALRQVADAVADRIHPLDKIPVVRILEERKDKAGSLLIAAGSRSGLTKGTLLQVYRTETYLVADKSLQREVPLARVQTAYVENADFSQVKVLSGEKEISQALREGIPLFARKIRGLNP